MSRVLTQYKTTDGKLWDDRSAAESRQEVIDAEPQRRFDHFTQVAYSGRKLLETHDLDDEGVWRVFGEDENPNFFGAHNEPYLGTYEGTLRNAIKFYVMHPGWSTWGVGGRIMRVNR